MKANETNLRANESCKPATRTRRQYARAPKLKAPQQTKKHAQNCTNSRRAAAEARTTTRVRPRSSAADRWVATLGDTWQPTAHACAPSNQITAARSAIERGVREVARKIRGGFSRKRDFAARGPRRHAFSGSGFARIFYAAMFFVTQARAVCPGSPGTFRRSNFGLSVCARACG